MRVLNRTFLTAALVAGAYGLFLLSPGSRTTTETVDETTTITTVTTGGKEFFEWVALFCLALAVWLWRRYLNITSIGVLGGPTIEQQTPEEVERDRTSDASSPKTFDGGEFPR